MKQSPPLLKRILAFRSNMRRGIPKDEYEEWIAQCILRDDLPDILFVPSEYFSTLGFHSCLTAVG